MKKLRKELENVKEKYSSFADADKLFQAKNILKNCEKQKAVLRESIESLQQIIEKGEARVTGSISQESQNAKVSIMTNWLLDRSIVKKDHRNKEKV